MSQIIDLQSPSVDSVQQLKQKLKSIFRSNLMICTNIVDNGKQLTFFIKQSQNTYRFSTIWTFTFAFTSSNFMIQIRFYNKQESDLLKAYNSRSKIQIAILIRRINLLIMPNLHFCIQQSGALKLVYISQDIRTILTRQQLFKILIDIFKLLKLYDELMIFIQPHFSIKQAKDNLQLLSKQKQQPYYRLNKIRCLLRNTLNTRNCIQAPFWDMIRVKASNQQFVQSQIQQLGILFMQNIVYYQQSQIGLEDADQYVLDKQIFLKQIIQKNVHQKSKPSQQMNNQKDLDKILFGLLTIKPLDKQSSQQQMKQLKQQQQQQQIGAHSQILSKKFQYLISQTIHAGVVGLNNNLHKQMEKKKQGQLIYKTCNTNAQASINSFRNQLNFLKYVRDMSSPFIARYYLLVKQSWNQKDTIYMNKYKQNVYDLITRRRSLNIKAKLQLSYRIAKGLCFLYSKQIVHRDFKPQNIVVDSFLTPKIIDFGSCASHYKKKSFQQKFKPHDQRLLSTPGFHISYKKAIQQNRQFDKKISKKQFQQHPLFDVYGLGKTINFIFFGTIELPHPQNFQNQPLFQVLQNIIYLLQLCNSYDPDNRPSFGQITAFLGALNQLISNKSVFIKQAQKQLYEELDNNNVIFNNSNTNNMSNSSMNSMNSSKTQQISQQHNK